MIPPTPERITGLVLAGGLGRRMGGVDKGLSLLDGEPLVEHIIRRLAPQVGQLIINANQNHDIYAGFGYPVVGDRIEGHAGPLAGLEAGLAACTTPYLLTVPCDSPFLPADLVERLATALHAADAQLAVAKTFDQPHPVFCLCRRDLAEHLGDFLAGGGRKIDRWYGSLKVVEVAFDDEEAAFRNINTRDELAAAAKDLPAGAA